MAFFALALAMVATAGDATGQNANGRTVTIGPNPEWTQLLTDEKGRLFMDSRSVNSANGLVRYVGRIVFAQPDENGAVEIIHLQEVNCAGRTIRTMGFDVLRADGTIVVSRTDPADSIPVVPNSPGDTVYKKFCH